MIQERTAKGVRLPFGTDPALAERLQGAIGSAYGQRGPVEVRPDGMVIEVDGARVDVPIPDGVTWAIYLPVTQRIADLAEDRAGRPSKHGETIAREMRGAGAELRGVARQAVLDQLDRWGAAHKAKIVVDVDVEGLDAQATEKAAETARDAALKALAAMAVQTLSLPGLAARAARIERLLDVIETPAVEPDAPVAKKFEAAFSYTPQQRDAVDELVGAVRGLLEGVPRPLTEDNLDDTEYQAVKLYRRRNRDVMREEARQVVQVEGWSGRDHFDRLPEAQQTEAIGHIIRMKELGPPKDGASSPASG